MNKVIIIYKHINKLYKCDNSNTKRHDTKKQEIN